MQIGLIIIFLIVMGVWVGRQEIAYSFAGLHVSEILSLRSFGIYLLLSLLVSLVLVMLFPHHIFDVEENRLYDLVTGMLLTVLIVSSLNMRTSVVTAFWGALGGLLYFHRSPTEIYPFVACLLSWLIFPLCSLLLTYLYYRVIDRYAKKADIHLLTRLHTIREIAFVGVILCGIALIYNYFLLYFPVVTTVSIQLKTGRVMLWGLLLTVGIVWLVSTLYQVRKGYGNTMDMNRHIAMLYSLMTIIVLSTLVSVISSLLMPAVISANQVKELNNIFLDKQKRHIHLLNVTTISLLTPLLAFLVSMLLASLLDDLYLKSATVVFIVLLSILAHLYFNQWMKHSKTMVVLYDEQQRREEADKEINRLDVLAVTSQFNVLSKEIDLKQKELINLSLYLRQQREFLEELSKHLFECTRVEQIGDMRKAVTQYATDLRDNLKLSEEMDKFFMQVDEMQKNFVSRLMMRCPGISEREKRLAILLRLGYSSKEIGSLMNIETKSVEIGRYRLRKKLKMDRSENIVHYLQLL